MAYSGKFYPKNPHKYIGNVNNIVWRSSWELRLIKFLDENPNCLEYASEEIVIPYYSPLDRKMHRYFVDFYAKIKDKSGKVTKYLVEVKPFKQTQEPKQRKIKSQQYIKEVCEYVVNQSKWKAAEEFAKKNGMEFIVLTEKELFNK